MTGRAPILSRRLLIFRAVIYNIVDVFCKDRALATSTRPKVCPLLSLVSLPCWSSLVVKKINKKIGVWYFMMKLQLQGLISGANNLHTPLYLHFHTQQHLCMTFYFFLAGMNFLIGLSYILRKPKWIIFYVTSVQRGVKK